MAQNALQSQPPSYVIPAASSGPQWTDADSQQGLPEYSQGPGPPESRPHVQRPREPSEFKYNLTRKGKPWAILTVIADSALSEHIPTIIEGSEVKGNVMLSLESGDPIQAVTVTIRGQVITGANAGEQFTFLSLTATLWSLAMGDPSTPSAGVGPFSGKLKGDYSWPFSIELPKEIVLPMGPRDSPQTFRLPQTFMERHTRASIQYDLVVKIVRSKFRTDDKIPMTFGFVPLTQPGPPSLLRQLAYQENSPLAGPDVDPDGWHTLPAVQIRGRIFNHRYVDAKCTLSIAKPLCYTRGSVIPCAMAIEAEDLQALDLLSSPHSIVLRLRRRVRCQADARKTVDSFAWKDAVDHSELATWWSPTSNTASSERYLNGELHLKGDMQPTSAMAHFCVEYSIVLFPFDAVTFESTDTEPLLIEPVEIATTYATGPTPRVYTPPGYESHTVIPELYHPLGTRGVF